MISTPWMSTPLSTQPSWWRAVHTCWNKVSIPWFGIWLSEKHKETANRRKKKPPRLIYRAVSDPRDFIGWKPNDDLFPLRSLRSHWGGLWNTQNRWWCISNGKTDTFTPLPSNKQTNKVNGCFQCSAAGVDPPPPPPHASPSSSNGHVAPQREPPLSPHRPISPIAIQYGSENYQPSCKGAKREPRTLLQ